METILPFVTVPQKCLSTCASQGLVYAFDSQIVLKVPFQHRPTDCLQDPHYLDSTLRSFVAFENELEFYQYLEHYSHPNLVRRIKVERNDCLFLERLTPLESAWPAAKPRKRSRWALQLSSALSWLEQHGWCTGDLAVRNIGIDDKGQLKLFDFGSAVKDSHEDFANDMKREHFNFATCLLFVFHGIDPFAEARSYGDVKRITKELEDGLFRIPDEAAQVADIIREGWQGHYIRGAFQEIHRRLKEIFPEVDTETKPNSQSNYTSLETRCQEWLLSQESNSDWMIAEEYVAACRTAGVEVDLDVWR